MFLYVGFIDGLPIEFIKTTCRNNNFHTIIQYLVTYFYKITENIMLNFKIHTFAQNNILTKIYEVMRQSYIS